MTGKGPMKKLAIPARYRLRVKQRLTIVQYALAHGIKPASRRFGLERKTIRRWRDRWRSEGLGGLVPRYPTQRPSRLAPELVRLIEHARRTLEYGAPRVRVWLRRAHKREVSLAAIQRRSSVSAFRDSRGAANVESARAN